MSIEEHRMGASLQKDPESVPGAPRKKDPGTHIMALTGRTGDISKIYIDAELARSSELCDLEK